MKDAASTKQVLGELHKAAASLQALLRGRPALTEAEQLFLENRLMMMQIEYHQWAKFKHKGNVFVSEQHTEASNDG